MAVGNSTGIEVTKSSGPYAEEWHGTSWRLLEVPGPRSLAYYGLGLAAVGSRRESLSGDASWGAGRAGKGCTGKVTG
jgi:hypothetical protein